MASIYVECSKTVQICDMKAQMKLKDYAKEHS